MRYLATLAVIAFIFGGFLSLSTDIRLDEQVQPEQVSLPIPLTAEKTIPITSGTTYNVSMATTSVPGGMLCSTSMLPAAMTASAR